jgi:hypothetical protein
MPSSITAKRPLARLATPVSRPSTYSPRLGRRLPADALHLLTLQRCNGPVRDVDGLPGVRGVPHLHRQLGAPVKLVLHFPAESRLGRRRRAASDKLTVESGHPIVVGLPFEVEGREGAPGDRRGLEQGRISGRA